MRKGWLVLGICGVMALGVTVFPQSPSADYIENKYMAAILHIDTVLTNLDDSLSISADSMTVNDFDSLLALADSALAALASLSITADSVTVLDFDSLLALADSMLAELASLSISADTVTVVDFDSLLGLVDSLIEETAAGNSSALDTLMEGHQDSLVALAYERNQALDSLMALGLLHDVDLGALVTYGGYHDIDLDSLVEKVTALDTAVDSLLGLFWSANNSYLDLIADRLFALNNTYMDSIMTLLSSPTPVAVASSVNIFTEFNSDTLDASWHRTFPQTGIAVDGAKSISVQLTMETFDDGGNTGGSAGFWIQHTFSNALSDTATFCYNYADSTYIDSAYAASKGARDTSGNWSFRFDVPLVGECFVGYHYFVIGAVDTVNIRNATASARVGF